MCECIVLGVGRSYIPPIGFMIGGKGFGEVIDVVVLGV